MERYHYSDEQRSLLENNPVPFAIYQFINKRVVTLILSDGFMELFGYKNRELAYHDMDHDMYKDTHPDDVSRIADAAFRFATEEIPYNVVYRTKYAETSEYKVVHAIGKHIYTSSGIRLAYVGYTDEGLYAEHVDEQDNIVSCELKNLLYEESARNASYYDHLTGLPSMTYFFELADAGKTAIQKDGGNVVMLFFDLCGMKYYNTKYGFQEGDKLLISFAKLLTDIFSNENCCRISADHFAVYCRQEGLEKVLGELFESAHNLNEIKTVPVHVGIYVAGTESVTVSGAFDRAKIACDSIKSKFGSCYNYYDPELRDEAEMRQYVLTNLDRAIADRWITVYYQPIVRTVSGHVCDEEALARWIDPERGFLSPADFIPYLEDAEQIYKLDLYMLDRVLEKMKSQRDAGLSIVPHSINLSRSDFDACDIVEEVRRRVDASGFGHSMITIEVTESVIGRDYEFMKEQITRFQALGFPVWMDDFGSGYSSLDVLQSIKFNLLKFDMSFMKKLGEGESGKILLTELMRMANSLGMDTVCEGVETKEQVKFLREIGCSKIQGYYFCKPIPLDEIMDRYNTGRQIGYENPEESDYFETIGRLNLYDLSVMSQEEGDFRSTFNTIPIGLIEVSGDSSRFVRSNPSYRKFIKRFFGFDLSFEGSSFVPYNDNFMINVVKTCCEKGVPSFYDEQMQDGSVVHSFARRIGIDPVTGNIAVMVAVLSITGPDDGTTYAGIARALAADYYNIYYVDLDTDRFIEYTSPVGGEELAMERHGEDFFGSVQKDTMTRIYEEDRESFLAGFSKEKIIEGLDKQGVYNATYRLIDGGTPVYANMKITRMQGRNKIILGVSIIDSQMKQQEEERKLRQEKISLGRIAALSPDYLVLYTVDPVTGHYTEYNPSEKYKAFNLASQGEDFFADVILDAPKAIAPDDLERHLNNFTKENMMRSMQENGLFIHNYRLMLDGKPVPVSLRASLVKESDGEKIIIGVTNDEEEYRRKLEKAYKKASDTVTVYTHLAHALARDYTDLFYVNMETDELIEFHTDDEHGVLNEIRRSSDFFEGCERDAKTGVHPNDQAAFVQAMNKDFLEHALSEKKVFELTYRRIKDGAPFYVLMKVTRMEDDRRIIVIAVQNIDEQVRQRTGM